MDKLLWHSNAPWVPTGYGAQTGLLVPQLKEHYEVAVSSFYGLEGAPINWRQIPVLPGMGGTFGNETIAAHARLHFGGDIRSGLVVTLMDVWVLDPKLVSTMNVACWVPVDHLPASPNVKQFFALSGAVPLAMSQFGMQELAEFDPIYVPHAVDMDAYKPLPKFECRELLGVPQEAFVVGVVAANKGRPSRKGFQQGLEAFRLLRERVPEAHLYLHTILAAEHSQGEDLPALLRSLEIPEECVTVSSQYRSMYMPWQPAEMAHIFNSFDVLLNPAYGEGFGIPVLEAQACGVPVVVTDFSAMSEVAGPASWKVLGRGLWTGQNSWQSVPDVGQLRDALVECYERPSKNVSRMAAQAVEHAKQYALPKVMAEHMLPALREVEERIGAPPGVPAEAEAVEA